MFGFGKPPPPPTVDMKEKVKEWQHSLKAEMRGLDRQVREVQRDEEKLKREIVAAAKKDPLVAKMLAKNVVKCRNTVERLIICKAQINSVSMQLQTDAAMMRVGAVMGKSATIMKTMNRLVNGPAVTEAIRSMASEMQRAGIISEMMDDAMAAAEPAGLEEEADEEVEKVMYDLTAGLLGKAPDAPVGVPGGHRQAVAGGAASSAGRVAVGAGLPPGEGAGE